MKTGKTVKGTAISMPAGIALGVSVSMLLTSIFSAVLTWLMLEGRVSEKAIGYCILGVLIIATIMGALLSAIKVKRRWMLVCCATGVGYYLSLLACTALFFGGNYSGIGVTGVSVFVGSMVTGLLGLARTRNRNKRYKKYRSC